MNVETDPVEEPRLDAGGFTEWLTGIQAALRGEGGVSVPCGTCTACCTSSQFVHVEPDEHETLAHIPVELLFAAPHLPAGHMVMGYDERGHCPMLVDGACSVYEHRPRTCRVYDCRVFSASGVEVDDPAKDAIARRVRRWEFRFPTDQDGADLRSVRAAAASVGGEIDATRRSLLAITTHVPGKTGKPFSSGSDGQPS